MDGNPEEFLKEAVYENCLDLLYYGYGFDKLNRCGLSEEKCRAIWEMAKNKMAEEF